MNRFEIKANGYLSRNICAFNHADYKGGGNWRIQGTIENLICTLKNDITPYPQSVLNDATAKLSSILSEDLPQILEATNSQMLRVCVIPRAKHEEYYSSNQKLFRYTVQQIIKAQYGFEDGTHDIIRHTDTKTTHLARRGNGGNGPTPYRGITNDTCTISNNVYGKDILLIDDLYTRTVNIDEDAVQALLDNGAKSVVFYSIGKTIFRGF